MFQINFSFKLIVTSAFAFQVIKINHAKQSLKKKKKKVWPFFYYYFSQQKAEVYRFETTQHVSAHEDMKDSSSTFFRSLIT